jgi:hypothetical protein
MKKALMLIVAGAMALTVAAAAPAALAVGSAVTRSGTCGAHPWSLVLTHDGGRIEADYKLSDVNVGSSWRVVMKDNGVRFFRGTRTAGAERHIEVDKFTQNRTGTDKISVRAANLATSQVCTATASIS